MLKNKKRPDGRLKSAIYLGQVEGKAQYKYVYADNNRDLEHKVQEIKTKLGKGLDLTAERDSFAYWAKRWLKIKQSELSPNRAKTAKTRCDNLSPLNDMEISKIRAADIQDLILDLATEPNPHTGKPYSRYTLTEIKNCCAQIVQLAVDNRVIDYNPAKAVKLPKETRKPETRRALTEEEQRWIREFPHRAQTAGMIMMYAGLRRGELLALTWSDINLDEKTIRVERSVTFDGNAAVVKDGGKSDAATRTVYIPQLLADYLRKVPGIHFGYVVQKQSGGIMTSSAWDRLWESYLDDLNLRYGDWEHCLQTNGKRPSKYSPKKNEKKPMLIPRFTAHWLRHTFITLMYMAGVDILTAKEQAGHEDIETTMTIYTHLDEQFKKKNVSKLDEYLSQESKKKVVESV